MRPTALALAVAAIAMGVLGAPVSLADELDLSAGAARAEVTLRKGDRGPAVRKVQRRLRLSADGVFGPMTHRTVRRFQRRKRLTVDGIVGPVTRRRLRLKPFPPGSVRHPRRSRDRDGPDAEEPSGDGLSNLPAALSRIARCESGGNPKAVSAGGRYRGKYQFLRATWRRWGGRGRDPARASERHQDRVALRLYRARGAGPWPTCGRR
ncbi:MAG: transglycosylase family protein [Thermoleophilaceae bacterium]